ncbi:uncharacterized protein BJ171DRAFT_519546 [Polychytrium aggregatum]|uniref:uncharacterized protein n=1 Tax=Polychytrium aggregatum TaxID=110093 RepID=UPI0022FEF030|nr:uncharacterized protein BJ171DRAFT_519546 [Polychytrium aggregatum]KAI9197444.1 hypothetical protein BJ171DRAFT_519546 [Polychytrium aggregatum]
MTQPDALSVGRLIDFTEQVAGHPDTIKAAPQFPDRLFKWASPTESQFYRALDRQRQQSQGFDHAQTAAPRPLYSFAPAFYPDFDFQPNPLHTNSPASNGKSNGDGDGNDDGSPSWICIQNLIHRYQHYSAIDLKLGTRLYDDDATPEKRARMIQHAQQTTSGAIGLRICGYKRFDLATQSHVVYSREAGRRLKPDTFYGDFESFFRSNDGGFVSLDTLRGIRHRLCELQQTLRQTHVQLYGASVLILYDSGCCFDVDPGQTSNLGEPNAPNQAASADEPRPTQSRAPCPDQSASPRYDVRLIDFAHARLKDGIGLDEGALLGVDHLIRFMDRLILAATSQPMP